MRSRRECRLTLLGRIGLSRKQGADTAVALEEVEKVEAETPAAARAAYPNRDAHERQVEAQALEGHLRLGQNKRATRTTFST